jgi:putative copper resistance protein D
VTDIRTAASGRIHLVTTMVAAALVGVLAGLAITATDPVAGMVEPDAAVRFGLPIVRVLLNLAAVVTVGLSLLPILMGGARPKLAEPVLAAARRISAVSALIWALCALVALVLQTAELRADDTVSPAGVVDYVSNVGAGKALLFVAGLALASFVLALLSVRAKDAGNTVPAELRAAVALFALLPLPVTGHSTDVEWADFTMISVELHVLAAATWTGGLGAMAVLLAANRTLLASTIPRFSQLATVCLAVVVVTGLFNAGVELAGSGDLFDQLFGSGYGVLVLLKLGCFCVLTALGANIRWRLLPAIERHQRTALVAWAGLELAVMGLAFGFAVALSRTPL